MLGWKYLAKNTLLSSFHVVIEFTGRDCSHALALSLRENGNKYSLMASGFEPLLFNVFAYCTNTDKWRFGSSVGFLENWFYWTICIWDGFNSKEFAWIVGGTMLECGSSLFSYLWCFPQVQGMYRGSIKGCRTHREL